MTGMVIDLNNMYIEDSAVAFDSLDDGFSDEQLEQNSLGTEHVEAEDLVDFEDLEDEVEEIEEVEEELEEEGLEEEEVEAEEEYEEIEDEEVDFEEYDVTLPNGEVIKLHEAVQGYKDSKALLAEREAFEAEKTTYEQSNLQLKRVLDLAKLEAERVIEDYAEFDWATLSRDDPQAYVENREFLDKYKARHKEILAEMQWVESKLEEEKKAEVTTKAAAANQILTRDIPGWNKDMYVDLMTYAVNGLGMDESFVTESVDAGFFKAIFMARQLEQGKQTVKAKIKRIGGSPKKVVKAAPKAAKAVDSKKAVITKRLESGSFDANDLGAAFGMLED